ncbi:hypothetical protein [Brevundimonas sp. M20]|jgi:hypothetical protein|uniref:hypothetical protein n=1 Tax=Brevundimonas sp. M20 TaxID=2591463 RepID=UPI001146B9D9|nr:hypothetical protein [Brevundimonas sp. M20]QDH73702.1 hypothetical protein FKQ52_09850 [Brevundimonas sp. M20]
MAESQMDASRGRMIVRCLSPGCVHVALMDARTLFGSTRDWPAAGTSQRFRCVCGGRESRISYAGETAPVEAQPAPDAIHLWG